MWQTWGKRIGVVLVVFLIGWFGAWGQAKFATLWNDYQDFQKMRSWVAAVQLEQARAQAAQRNGPR